VTDFGTADLGAPDLGAADFTVPAGLAAGFLDLEDGT
jgi:hypothetical protein